MGLLDQIIANDAAAFVDTDGFGEAVTYTPHGGTAASINAVVDRDPPELAPETGRGRSYNISIFVRKADVPVVNTAGDKVTLPVVVGGAAVPLSVVEIIAQDTGGWTLLLR